MSSETITFGGFIATSRQLVGLNQKELAKLVKMKDGRPISAQYLSDIENNRRNPSSSFLIEQFTTLLKVDKDYLYYLAGRVPEDIVDRTLNQGEFSHAMLAFRKSLDK